MINQFTNIFKSFRIENIIDVKALIEEANDFIIESIDMTSRIRIYIRSSNEKRYIQKLKHHNVLYCTNKIAHSFNNSRLKYNQVPEENWKELKEEIYF